MSEQQTNTRNNSLFAAFRTRDILLLGIFVWTLYYCWHEKSYFDYHLDPAWFVQNPVSEVNRRGRRVLNLVPPLLTDLDGNGKQELVAIVSMDAEDGDDAIVVDNSASFRLLLLDVYKDPTLALQDVYHPRILAGMPLSGSKYSPPVAIAAGIINTELSDTEEKEEKGRVFLAFDNMTVSSFIAVPNVGVLSKDWSIDLVNLSSSISGGLSEAHRYRCPSQYVTRIHLHPSQENILLLSMSPAPPRTRETTETQDLSCNRYFANINHHEDDRGSVLEEKEEETVRVFAFSAENGDLLWQFHSGADDESETALALSLPQHPLSLDLRQQLLHHYNNNNNANTLARRNKGYHWQMFRDSLINQLPFAWFDDDDESLHTAHFKRPAKFGDVTIKSPKSINNDNKKKQNLMKKAPEQKKKKQKIAKIDKTPENKKQTSLLQLPLSPVSQMKWSTNVSRHKNIDNSESSLKSKAASFSSSYLHTQQHRLFQGRGARGDVDNVVVLRHSGGMQVLALHTGTPLASLSLSHDKIYADMNGDMNIDAFYFPFHSQNNDNIVINNENTDHIGEEGKENEKEVMILGHATRDTVDCAAICVSGLPPTISLFNSTALCGLGLQNRRVTHTGAHSNYQGRKRGGAKARGGRGSGRGSGRRGHLAPPSTLSHSHVATDTMQTAQSQPTSEKTPLLPVSYAIPLVIPRSKEDVQNSKNKRHAEFANEAILSAVTFTSVGVLTALDQRGDVLWQDFHHVSPFSPAKTFPDFVPRLLMFNPFQTASRSNNMEVLVVVQESSLLMMSVTGQLLHTVKFPARLVTNLILLGDDNTDGVLDTLIVMTESAILGYRIEVKSVLYPMFLPLAVLLGIAALVLLSKLQLQNVFGANYGGDFPPSEESWNKWWLKTTRATDSLHLD